MPAAPPQPDPVGEQNVIECSVYRTKEGTKIAPPLVIGERGNARVEAAVEPPIVLRRSADLPQVSVPGRFSGGVRRIGINRPGTALTRLDTAPELCRRAGTRVNATGLSLVRFSVSAAPLFDNTMP